MEKLKRSLGSFIVPLLSIILAFVIGGIIMAALGANPFDAVKYLFQGAFGSKANIGTTLTKATPLMFTSLCACFAYKCGVFNLGGEGQFLMGSIAAFVTAYFSGVTGFAGVLLALLAGTLAGGIWGMIPGLLKIGRGQNEMIISIMLNYVATLFMGVLYTSWIRDASVPQTPAVDDLVKLPRVITGMRFTWGFVIAVVVGLVLYYVLFWTSGGFKLRAVGYVDQVSDLHRPDMILLPGTKSTIADLRWLRQSGLEAAILKAADAGTLIFGVCGGYQMLGHTVSDPEQVEAAGVTEISGLGLLDMDTEFRGEKVQAQTKGIISGVEGMLSPLNGLAYEGYEIHMGRSRQEMPALSGGGNVYGSYVHGIFDAPGIADTILRALCARKGVSFDALATFDARGYKERQYDLLADVVRGGLDMSFVYRVLRREV